MDKLELAFHLTVFAIIIGAAGIMGLAMIVLATTCLSIIGL